MKITGILLSYDPKRGFGFIEADKRLIFIHYSEIASLDRKALLPGDEVLFDLYVDPKDHTRYIAKNLEKVY